MTLGLRERELLSSLDPRELQGLEAWYDARYINGFSGVAPADGANLAQWNDLSGNNRHGVQATAILKPFYRTAQSANTIVNYHPNPRCKNNINAWQSNDATKYPIAWDNTVGLSANSTASCKVTRTATGLSNVLASIYMGRTTEVDPLAMLAAPGDVFHITIKVKCSRASKMYLNIDAFKTGVVITTGGAPVSSPYLSTMLGGIWYSYDVSLFAGSIPTTPANTVQVLHVVTGAMPANTGCVLAALTVLTDDLLNCAGGETINVSEILVEKWPSNGPYLDGDLGTGFGWSGTAHQSTTIQIPSLPVRVQFDGINDFLATTAAIGISPSPATIYAVYAQSGPNSAISNSRIMGVGNHTSPTLEVYSPPTLICIYPQTVTSNAIAQTPGTRKVFSGWGDGVNAAGVGLNGVKVADLAGTGPSGLGFGPFFVGATNGGGAPFYGGISAALVFSKRHDEATRRRIEQWLASIYGVTLART